MLNVREWMVVARRIYGPLAIMSVCNRSSLYTVKTKNSSEQMNKKVARRT